MRKTGIEIIGDASWGTHLCQFYQTSEDLIDILVPYFKTGLENNEFCMWITSEPLTEKEAIKAMRNVLPDFDQYLKKGQIEIIPHTEWYLKDGSFNLQRVLNAWIDKLNQSLAKGYDGMRVTGNTAWLEKRDWKDFSDYEKAVNNAIGKYRMLAICTYSLDKCGVSEVIDVVRNHQFALIKREGKWIAIESYENRQTQEELRQYREHLEDLVKDRTAALKTINEQLRLEVVERKRAEQNYSRRAALLDAINMVFQETLRCETDVEVASKCLSVAEKLTGSKFGFIGELNLAGLFDTLAISNPGWDACKVPDSTAVKIIKNMELRGVDRSTLREEKSRIVNDPASHPDSVGVPKGHPPITCFLGVPLKHLDKTIGMIGLANKDGGYTPADQEDIETLSIAFVEAFNRKRTEKEIKKLNEDLQHRTVELEKINRELEAFSYSVSHDLRGPLRSMDGFSHVLLEDHADKLDEDGKEHLKRIRAASQRMAQLIDDLLSLSRITQSGMYREKVNLSLLAERIVGELKEKQPERKVEFVIAPELVVDGDVRFLQIALEHLLDNAWKFTGKNAHARIEFGGIEHEGKSAYFVRDNGIGFDMTYANKLFTPFQRLHSEIEFPGTGIGLAVVQRIIHRHGGSVWTEGAVEKGATFYFTLLMEK